MCCKRAQPQRVSSLSLIRGIRGQASDGNHSCEAIPQRTTHRHSPDQPGCSCNPGTTEPIKSRSSLYMKTDPLATLGYHEGSFFRVGDIPQLLIHARSAKRAAASRRLQRRCCIVGCVGSTVTRSGPRRSAICISRSTLRSVTSSRRRLVRDRAAKGADAGGRVMIARGQRASGARLLRIDPCVRARHVCRAGETNVGAASGRSNTSKAEPGSARHQHVSHGERVHRTPSRRQTHVGRAHHQWRYGVPWRRHLASASGPSWKMASWRCRQAGQAGICRFGSRRRDRRRPYAPAHG